VFNCDNQENFARQISQKEGAENNIGGLEALALEMCILNLQLNPMPKLIR